MPLNFNLLRSFHAVAEAGSVAKAAKEGYISQPGLSKAVKELEKQLGVPLFERGARGVTLTSSGQALLEHTQAIFALEREAEAAVRSTKSLEGVTLRVGASTTIATYVLPPILALFQESYPGVRFSLTRDNTAGIEKALLNFDLDVALVEGVPHDSKLEKTFWRDDELIFICAPNHVIATKRNVTFAELKTCNWLVRERGSGTREVIEAALHAWDLPPENAQEIGGAETIKQAVAANLGIACVSHKAALDQLALQKLRRVYVPNFTIHRPFYLLHLPSRPLLPVAKAFEAFLLLSK